MGLFEPDTLIEDEWTVMFRGEAALSSEKRLMLAVLKSALQSYQKHAFARGGEELLLFKEAAEWIESDYSEWFFSFESICENLEINPGQLRRRLVRWREEALRLQAGASPAMV